MTLIVLQVQVYHYMLLFVARVTYIEMGENMESSHLRKFLPKHSFLLSI